MKNSTCRTPQSLGSRMVFYDESLENLFDARSKNVIEQLEKDDPYESFILDGQASLLDDYLKWRPQDKERIQQLVQQGKLIIGPWYTNRSISDLGESIVRNMLYGMKICEAFGPT